MASTRGVEFDWAGPHGTFSGTVNAAGGAMAVAMVGYLVHLDQRWAVGVAAAGALGMHLVDRGKDVSRATRRYRLFCWLAGGGWVAWAIGHNPWTVEAVAALAVLATFAGVMAPGFAWLDQRQAEERRRLVIASGRSRRGSEWEDRIKRVSGVKAEVVGIEEWPEGTGFDLDLELPEGGVTWRSLVSHQDGLAADARLPNGCGVEVKQGVNRRAAIVGVSTVNELAEHRAMPTDYEHLTVNNPVWIGWERNGAHAEADMRQSSWYVAGQKGTGKSTLLNVKIRRVAQCVDTLVWIIDLNGGALGVPWALPWWEGRAERPAVDWIAWDGAEALLMTEAALAVALDRKVTAAVIKRRGNVTLMPVSPDLPEIVIFGDEIAEVIGERTRHPQVRDNLSQIIRIARDAAVNAVLAGLRGTSDVVDPALLKQCAVRVAMGVADEAELAYILGDWQSGVKPEDAPYQGCGVLLPGRQERARPFKGPDMLPEDIDAAAVAVADRRPALDGAAVAAVARKLGADVYARRWERAAVLFDTPMPVLATAGSVSASAGDGDGPPEQLPPPSRDEGEGPVVPGSADDAIARAEEAGRAMRRAAAEAEGRDPDLEEQFRDIMGGMGEAGPVDWSDPSKWPEPNIPREPEPDVSRPGARDRVMQLLAEAGPGGTSPTLIAEQMQAEGYSTVRQTVAGWLSEAVATGSAVQLARGMYAAAPKGEDT